MTSNRDKLKKILNDHSNWILSLGKTGKLANFNSWNLDKVNLKMANLPFAKLHLTSLKNANLTGVNFRQAELAKVNLINSNLEGADFEGANLSNGDLSFTKCMGANFTDANLEGANLEGANLYNTNFTRAILRGASLKGADLSSSEMVDANIEGADFKGAKIEATNFEGANLGNANFEETHLKVYNIKEYLPQGKFKDNHISNPQRNEAKSPESEINNHKSDKVTSNRTLKIKSAEEDSFVDLNAINPGMIEEAIIDLIEKVKSNIQFDQVQAICKHQHVIDKIDKIDFKHGDIVTHDGEVAIKLDFKISYNLSLLLDRQGKLINIHRSIAKKK